MAILKNIFQNVAVLYSLFIIVFLAWGLNKGLDLTDEGLYLLQLKYPLEYGDSSNWLSGFLGLINLNVTDYRLLRLVLTIFLSGYLTVHLSKFIQKQLPDYSNGTNIYVVFAFVFSGAALSYSIYPLTISYNTVTLFSLLLVVGQLFWLLNIEKSSKDNVVGRNLPRIFKITYFCRFLHCRVLWHFSNSKCHTESVEEKPL